MTVSLTTVFLSAFRSVCLLMTGLADTVMMAPLPRRLLIPNLLTLEVFAAVVADFAGAED